MIYYLAAGTEARGVADAIDRGGERIAKLRFGMPDKSDLRVVRNFADLVPIAGGKTKIIRGSDFHDAPDTESLAVLERWQENHDAFERFVAEGHGEWIVYP